MPAQIRAAISGRLSRCLALIVQMSDLVLTGSGGGGGNGLHVSISDLLGEDDPRY